MLASKRKLLNDASWNELVNHLEHDLKSPLSSIKTACDFASSTNDPEFIDLIMASLENLDQRVQECLDFYRPTQEPWGNHPISEFIGSRNFPIKIWTKPQTFKKLLNLIEKEAGKTTLLQLELIDDWVEIHLSYPDKNFRLPNAEQHHIKNKISWIEKYLDELEAKALTTETHLVIKIPLGI